MFRPTCFLLAFLHSFMSVLLQSKPQYHRERLVSVNIIRLCPLEWYGLEPVILRFMLIVDLVESIIYLNSYSGLCSSDFLQA